MARPFARGRLNAFALTLAFGFLATTANAALADAWNEYPYPVDGFAISAPSEPLKSTVSDSGTAASPLPTRTIIWRLPDGTVMLVASSFATNGWDAASGDPVDSVL